MTVRQSSPSRLQMQSLSDAFKRYSTSQFFTWSARDAYSIGMSFFILAFYFRDSIALESRLQRTCETPGVPALLAGILFGLLALESVAVSKRRTIILFACIHCNYNQFASALSTAAFSQSPRPLILFELPE
jgi:hypothetical protein